MSPELKTLHTSIETYGVKRSANHRLINSSNGGPMGWMIDLREVFLRPQDLDLICTMFWEKYQHKMPFQIGGMEVAAVPLVTGLLLKAKELGIPASGFIIRKERKKTGMGKNIEGALTSDPVILVDDLMNSGSSIEKSRVVVESEGMKVSEVFVVIDYHSPKGTEWRTQHNIPVNSFFNLSDFNDLKLNAPTKRPDSYQHYIPIWKFSIVGGNPFYINPKSAPLLYNNKLFLGSDVATFHAVDATTGRNLWQIPTPNTTRKGIWSSPAEHNGRIYFGSYNGNLYCVDANSGRIIWEKSVCEWIGSSPLIIPKHNLVVIGLEYSSPKWGGSHAAYNLDTGDRVWETMLKVVEHGSGTYYANHDLAIFGTNDHTIVAHNAANGEKVWELPTIRSIKYRPAVSEELDIAAATSFDGNIYIVRASTGEKLASFQTDNICYTTPLIVGKRLFCGSGDRNFYVIDLEKMELVKKIDFGARIYSNPQLIPPGNIIFGTCGGRVIEMNPETLEITGRLQLPDAITNAIAFTEDGNTIYVPTYINEIHAFQRKTIRNQAIHKPEVA